MKRLLSVFSLRYPSAIAYMLQSTEYMAGPYLAWYWRTADFNVVMHRRSLDNTQVARMILLFLRVGIGLSWLVGFAAIIFGLSRGESRWYGGGALGILLAPLFWAHAAVPVVVVARKLLIEPRQARLRNETRAILNKHPGITIAVAGSYGKTTVKELLATVLAEGKTVAATPGNRNVASSHAAFARTLTGGEEVVIIEYGESRPGDIARFMAATCPDIGIITGLAPAHLDQYKTLAAAADDILTLARTLPDKKSVYANGESPALKLYLSDDIVTYSRSGVGEWNAANITTTLEGTTFDLSNGDTTLHIHSGLLGAHLVGVLSMVAVLALQLGLTSEQVQAGMAKTKPYEHRMQPYRLGSAWIIDDAYNGNIEGVRAGTELLGVLQATRKVYVTPGLVDQGPETAAVHVEMGKLIAEANPDLVVLMHNSATPHIQAGLQSAGYAGEVRLEEEPLQFYTNLAHFVAAGDVVMLQNDWTDNYA
jgi:UDP-N-acetylmuramyl pentapeptide synthase